MQKVRGISIKSLWIVSIVNTSQFPRAKMLDMSEPIRH